MPARGHGTRADAPRAGSAEAKVRKPSQITWDKDAPRAGSAEAKRVNLIVAQHGGKDAPRAGSAEAKCKYSIGTVLIAVMHPVQAAPRQREDCQQSEPRERRCTPCRQRRGKEPVKVGCAPLGKMHPVQAAPRQSSKSTRRRPKKQRCTPCRQRRGKDKRLHELVYAVHDAPRAGSAEAKCL